MLFNIMATRTCLLVRRLCMQCPLTFSKQTLWAVNSLCTLQKWQSKPINCQPGWRVHACQIWLEFLPIFRGWHSARGISVTLPVTKQFSIHSSVHLLCDFWKYTLHCKVNFSSHTYRPTRIVGTIEMQFNEVDRLAQQLDMTPPKF